jgi:hypothetical protein
MKNLSGIQSHISNTIISIELAKAGVDAFAGELVQPGEVPASVVGIMAFADGTEVLFTRENLHWTIRYSQELPDQEVKELWSKGVRVYDNSEPSRCCHVDTQERLVLVVESVTRAFDVRCPVNPRKLVHLIKTMVAGTLKLTLAPSGVELDRCLIAALHSLGSAYNSYDRMEACYVEAADVATRAFGPKSREAYTTRVVLSNLYREEARRLKRLLDSQFLSTTDRCCATADLSRVLSKRIPILHEIKRHKEARSVKTESGEIRAITLRIRRATFPTCQVLRTAKYGDNFLLMLYIRSNGAPGPFWWELFNQEMYGGRPGRRCMLDNGKEGMNIDEVVKQGLERVRGLVAEG